MAKALENSYRLDNKDEYIAPADMRRAINEFEFFMSHYQQIVNKERQLVPFKLNAFQRRLFETILPMVRKETRLDRRHRVVVVKGRQVGASVGVVALINYICAFVSGMEHLNIGHVFPVGDTISKFYQQKVAPIITGVHPNLFPTMERETLSSSILTHYKDIKGIPRDNYYELISSGASSIRSSTVNVLLEDECLSGDTEVLTSNGYKKMRDVTTDDMVAQFSAESGNITYAHPLRKIEKHPTRKVYDVSFGRNDKVVMTGGHELLVKSVATGRYSKKELENVSLSNRWEIPVASTVNVEPANLSARDRLMIALQADGHLIEGADNTRARITLRKDRKITRFSKIIKEAAQEGAIIWNGKVEKRDGENRTTWNFQLTERINFKDLTKVFSFNEPPSRAKAIVLEMLEWDGYKGTINKPCKYYSSTHKANADLFCALGCLAGYNASQYVQVDKRSKNYSDTYRCLLSNDQYKRLGWTSKREIVWKDKVYCVTVPEGNIVIRAGQHHYIVGNCSFYAHPEQLEDAILPAMPDYGFSLIVYLSTVSDKKTTFFLDKIKAARDNPEDWSLVFVPWYFTYPEKPVGINFDSLILNEYEANVMVPAFERDNLPKERWGDCIDWYRRRQQDGTSMKMEYPTTLEEVLTIGEDERVFNGESLEKQEKNIEEPEYYRLVTDIKTGVSEAQKTDEESPFVIYKQPVYGRRYRLVVDPITAMSDSTDFFAMSVFDTKSHEQMATFHEKGLDDDSYADYAVAIAKIYNNAEICPEINVASGFVAGVNNRHYYRWYYANEKARKNREIRLVRIRRLGLEPLPPLKKRWSTNCVLC